MGQSNMRDYAEHYARICAAVELPVYVDADTGFGGVNNVRQMVRAFEAAGVSGVRQKHFRGDARLPGLNGQRYPKPPHAPRDKVTSVNTDTTCSITGHCSENRAGGAPETLAT